MIKEKLVEVLIKSAMNFEDETYRFYMRCIENESNERISELYKKLAAEEIRHRAKLESLLTTDLGDILNAEDPDVPGEIDFPGVVTREIPQTPDKVSEVLKMALEHEISSRNFYILLCKRSTLSVMKKTFQFLAAEEERHIDHVRFMLAELEK